MSPDDHKNVSGGVPPLAVKSMEPMPPGQLISVFCKVIMMAGGSVKVSVFVAVQPFASVVATW